MTSTDTSATTKLNWENFYLTDDEFDALKSDFSDLGGPVAIYSKVGSP